MGTSYLFDARKACPKINGMNDCKTVAQIREHLLKYTHDKGAVGKDWAWGYGVVEKKLMNDCKTVAQIREQPS